MFAYLGYKMFKDRKNGKSEDKDTDSLKCPNCSEKKKIDCVRAPNDRNAVNATCLKCGTQWSYEQAA